MNSLDQTAASSISKHFTWCFKWKEELVTQKFRILSACKKCKMLRKTFSSSNMYLSKGRVIINYDIIIRLMLSAGQSSIIDLLNRKQKLFRCLTPLSPFFRRFTPFTLFLLALRAIYVINGCAVNDFFNR